MTDYRYMDAPELHLALGGDGYKFAEAFRQYYPDCNVGDDALVCWFCNACMGGFDLVCGNPPLSGDHAQWLIDRDLK